MGSTLSERVAGFVLHLAQGRGASDVDSAMVEGRPGSHRTDIEVRGEFISDAMVLLWYFHASGEGGCEVKGFVVSLSLSH